MCSIQEISEIIGGIGLLGICTIGAIWNLCELIGISKNKELSLKSRVFCESLLFLLFLGFCLGCFFVIKVVL